MKSVVSAAENLELVQAEQRQHPHVAGSWLWVDVHAERALARGHLPETVTIWCRELRQQRTELLRTARSRRRR